MDRSHLPKISIIILNWNGWRDTLECLESIYRNNYPDYDVVVVDNGSEDESVQKIREYAEGKIEINSKFFKYNPNNKPIKLLELTKIDIRNKKQMKKKDNNSFWEYSPQKRLILIKNNENLRYAKGNNIGIQYALNVLNADFVFILNNDTVVSSTIIEEFVKFVTSKKNEKLGMIGPKIYYYYEPNKVWFAGSRVKWCLCDLPTIKDTETLQEVDVLSGCAQFISSEFLLNSKIKGYDPTYPPGYDNIEICLRAKKMGYKIYYLPTAVMWHKVGQSRIKAEVYAEKYVRQWRYRGINALKERERMLRMYYSGPKLCKPLLKICCFTYIPIKQLLQIVLDSRNPSTIKGIIKGHIAYIKYKIKTWRRE